jgi:hypothetical protein
MKLERQWTAARRREGMPGPRGAEGADLPHAMLHLQRLAGNQAVLDLLGKRDLPGPPPTVQRAVYLENAGAWQRKTRKTRKGLVGSRGRESILRMIDDNIPRFFATKQDMISYAKGLTDNMGYVGSARTWAMVDRFTVFGEAHDAPTTLPNLARAFRTDLFMYEPLIENVEAANRALRRAVARRARDIHRRVKYPGYRPSREQHQAEDLKPKLLRSLEGIACNESAHVVGTKNELRGLRWAILDAAAHAQHPHLKAYAKNPALYHRAAQAIVALEADPRRDFSRLRMTALTQEEFTDFKDGYVQFAQESIDLAHDAVPAAWAAFQGPGGWHRVNRELTSQSNIVCDYALDTHPLMLAERMRDFSMLQHIRAARNRGYLLFGIGEVHEKRLFDILDAENIPHWEMTVFLEDQRRQFTRPP